MEQVEYSELVNVTLCDTVDNSREWLLETTMFIVYGPVQTHYYFFVDGNYFVSKSRASVIETDDQTGQPILINFEGYVYSYSATSRER